jgi:hypothetical protein
VHRPTANWLRLLRVAAADVFFLWSREGDRRRNQLTKPINGAWSIKQRFLASFAALAVWLTPADAAHKDEDWKFILSSRA